MRCDQVRLPQRSEAPTGKLSNALGQKSRNISSGGAPGDPWNAMNVKSSLTHEMVSTDDY